MNQPTHIKDGKIYSGNNYLFNTDIMQGCSGSIAGVSGLVPAPAAGDEDKVLKGDGTWGMGGNDALIAPVETSSTSAHAYSIGQQFVYGGVLCKATAAISIGDTFTLNTNYELASDITTQIKAIVDAYVTGVKGDSETNYRKGNVNIKPSDLGIGTSAMNVAMGTGSTSVDSITATLSYKCKNTGATLVDKDLAMIFGTKSIGLWNNTDSQYEWSLGVPISIANGGTGSTAKNFVDLSNAQTVGGAKTFTSRPLIDLSGTQQTADTAYSVLSFKYKNPNAQVKQVEVIRTYGDSETAANNGIAIIGSSSGATIVSAGESAPTVIKNKAISANENIYLIADGNVNVMTNANTAANVASVATFNTDGTTTLGKPLPIGSGGTGLTTSPSMLTNLGSTSAANVLAASPRPGVTGTLGFPNGGTGATTRLLAAKALTNESVGTSATHFVTMTTSWGKFGYSTVANAQTVLGLGGAAYRPVTTSVTSGSTALVTSGGTYSALYGAIHDYGSSWSTSYSVTISETGSNAILFFNNLIISIWFYKNASGGYMYACVPGSYSDGGNASTAATLTRSTSGTVDTNTVKHGGNNWFYFTYNFSSGAFTAKRSDGGNALFHLIVFPTFK